MAHRDFADLVPRVSAIAEGCPHPVVVDAIRNAAIDVCERTLAWRFEMEHFPLTIGVPIYPYKVPPLADAHAIIAASVDGCPLNPRTLDEIKLIDPEWPSCSSDRRGTPRYVTQLTGGNFGISPPPDEMEHRIHMVLALKPQRHAHCMDKWVFDELEDPIFHGALQALLTMHGSHWADNQIATYHARQYVFRVAERRARANLGNQRGMVRVRPHPLA